ncbi:MAG TPA: glycosyltransferase family 4 protein [Anaerolineales bacterium]|nr:glycosyltransferase family 4 protein [Anaerolineales bacterium]
MRILFVADGRSPIAQNWIGYFAQRGDEVYLASSYPCSVDFPVQGLEITPVAFSGTKKSASAARLPSASALNFRSSLRHFLGPLTISRAAKRLRGFVQRVNPDLVHAMRIPYEGMLAADAFDGTPLLVSVWGNDFTLHAPSTALMSHYTRWTMQVADALHADCYRDIRLAKHWGFEPSKPTLVVPGNGGVRTDVFYPPSPAVDEPVIFNPRGFRAYVRNDVFFRSIPPVLKKHPNAKFICAAMANEPQALQWVDRLGIRESVALLPALPHRQMADVFRRAQIVVSPSLHDGTPNSLLEGMACGCFPIAGDLDSIREWITSGRNGLLTDAADPKKLAAALLEGLENKNLRDQAAGLNRKTITDRAEYARTMKQVENFYQTARRRL